MALAGASCTWLRPLLDVRNRPDNQAAGSTTMTGLRTGKQAVSLSAEVVPVRLWMVASSPKF
jgi:hypothetical protein